MDVHIEKLLWNTCHKAAYFMVVAMALASLVRKDSPYEQPFPELPYWDI